MSMRSHRLHSLHDESGGSVFTSDDRLVRSQRGSLQVFKDKIINSKKRGNCSETTDKTPTKTEWTQDKA